MKTKKQKITKTKKSVSKKNKKPVKKVATKSILNPVLYVHATHTGPQLCLKSSAKKADGVILPKAQQKELDALYSAWEKLDVSTDFMTFPKTKKWMKKLLSSFSFSEISSM